jgi:hypothetical protein
MTVVSLRCPGRVFDTLDADYRALFIRSSVNTKSFWTCALWHEKHRLTFSLSLTDLSALNA